MFSVVYFNFYDTIQILGDSTDIAIAVARSGTVNYQCTTVGVTE